MARISIVVPAWNEAERLPRLLDSIDAARARWLAIGHRAEAVEVIIADNGSTDSTAHLAAARGCQVVSVEKRVIAAARNGGAAAACGEILCFIDADSVLHPDSLVAVDRAMDDPRTLGGATGVTMERWSLGIAAVYALMLPMVWLTRFDTGLVFWRRADFELLGGYDERRRVAEDVDFLWRLRRLGVERDQRLRRLRGVKAVTSTRKFDAHGDWHWFTQLPRLLWQLLRNRRAFDDFVQGYWYGGR